jgi:hypothetical protein
MAWRAAPRDSESSAVPVAARVGVIGVEKRRAVRHGQVGGEVLIDLIGLQAPAARPEGLGKRRQGAQIVVDDGLLDVVCHETIGCFNDGRRATVVCWKLYQLRRKVCAQALDLPEASPVPLINDLIVVRDSEDIAEFVACHGTYKAVLCIIRVLKLVKQPIRMGTSITGCDGGKGGK